MPRAGIDKQVILQAAIEIANTEGLENVTLKALSQKLGIQTPSLYNHVKGLDDLKDMLVIYGLNQIERVLSEAAIGISGDDAVKSIAKAYLTFARNNPGLYEATQWINRWQNNEIKQASEGIINLIGKVVYGYNLKDNDITHVIRIIRSLLHGFASLEHYGSFGNPISADESFDLMLSVLIHGLHHVYDKGNEM